MKWLLAMLLVAGALLAPTAQATVRAWVVPERMALGDTATLNVETDGDRSAAPDFSALTKDFELRGTSSNTQMSFVNGRSNTRVLYAVVIEPREAGTFTISPIAVGNEQTAPVALTVLPSLPGSAQRGDAVYLETELDSTAPYVQQAVTYTLRLHYAMNLVDGAIDARAPDNATLSRLGDDRQYQQTESGRTYNILERRYVLVPERSGRIELPAPGFRGRALPSGFDPFARGGGVSAVGPARALDVKAEPDTAPQPWLPLASAALARNDVAAKAQAGEPLTLDISFTVDGALAAQLPELALPAFAGAQVFPEPQQHTDALAGSTLRATLRRRFAIVPSAAGRLEIPALRIPFWNTTTDRADVAELPALALDVAPGAAVAAVAATADTTSVANAGARPASALRTLHVWQGLSAALALALALALGLLWSQSRRRSTPLHGRDAQPPAAPDHASLRRALATGDFAAIAAALCAASDPAAASLGVLAARLDDADQRAAVKRLERALWAPSADKPELDATREALRTAFRQGPKFASASVRSTTSAAVLPPLYPAR